jgi:transcriptional regulator with XRE-family HTH domain
MSCPERGCRVTPSDIFRARMREVRQQKGWTQEELAVRASGCGVKKLDASAITRLEGGQRGATLDDAIAIAAALGVNLLELVSASPETEMRAFVESVRVRVAEAREKAEDAHREGAAAQQLLDGLASALREPQAPASSPCDGG